MAYSKEVEAQQAWLFDNGFFDPNISRRRAVDGYMGDNTNAAIQKAQAAGWTYNNGQWSKPEVKKPTLISRLFGQKKENSTTSSYTPWTPTSTEGSIVKGKKGPRTAQYFNEDTQDWDFTEQCAAWANAALRQFKDSNGQAMYDGNHVTGNAWTRLNSGRGTKMIFSGYEGMTYNPNDEQWAQAKADNEAWLAAEATKPKSGIVTDAMRRVFEESDKRNAQAADNFKNNFQADSLDRNKTYLVNMYYKGSPQRATAWFGAKNGTTGTHTGNLYWDNKSNSWRVAHNIHGKVFDEDFNTLQGSGRNYGITAVSEIGRRNNEGTGLISRVSRFGYDLGLWKQGGKLIPRNTKI